MLEPIHLTKYRGQEPEMVQQKRPNKQLLHINSQDSQKEDPADFIVRNFVSPSALIFENVSRISPTYCSLNWTIPNINPMNNRVEFFSSNTGLLINSVTMIEGLYTTPTLMMDELVRAMNTITGVTGLTFSYTIDPLFPSRFNLNSAGGDYYFYLFSPTFLFGQQLFSLPSDQTFTSTKKVGQVLGSYTEYVDVHSSILTKHNKCRLSDRSVFRIYIDNPFEFGKKIRFSETNLSNTFSFDPNEKITQFDIRLYDQYGRKLYIPDGTPFNFIMEFLCEI